MICLMTLANNCFAQTKSITKKEYETVQRIAESNFEKIPNISSTKIEEYTDGKLTKTTAISEESIPPKKMKWTEVETSGNETTKLEIITINYVEYRRENGDDWVKRDFSKSDEDDNSNKDGNSSGISISGEESPNKKKHTVEQAKFNNQSVRIYSVSTVYGFEPNIVNTYRRWINSDNLILKSEDTASEIKSRKIIRQEIVIYEYNLKNINIEAPIK